LTNPFALAGIGEAVDLIRTVVSEREPVVVYGDYDVDGVTAVAVLVETLKALGATVDPYIPNREDEGYGLNLEALRALRQDGAYLLITVDCGMRSLEEVAFARQLGLRVIVTDHHKPGERLPAADVVVNPKHPANADGLGELAGVGVAFELDRELESALGNHAARDGCRRSAGSGGVGHGGRYGRLGR
jgi:single-stranded-DNA-specific exonuclease